MGSCEFRFKRPISCAAWARSFSISTSFWSISSIFLRQSAMSMADGCWSLAVSFSVSNRGGNLIIFAPWGGQPLTTISYQPPTIRHQPPYKLSYACGFLPRVLLDRLDNRASDHRRIGVLPNLCKLLRGRNSETYRDRKLGISA